MMIPYELQKQPRMCGAAALAMAYRSLGIDVAQDAVWPQIVGKNGRGDDCARTHRLAADALRRGLAAVVLQARHPWDILAHEPQSVRMILNHRPTREAWTGHYTVRVERGADAVIVHDPQFGPNRRLRREDFLPLWLRTANPLCEITGNSLVAIALATQEEHSCAVCGGAMPPALPCPGCQRPVPLQPASLVGCVDRTCPGRHWERLFCPHCDAVVLGPMPQPAPVPSSPMMASDAGVGAGSSPLGEAMASFAAALGASVEACPPGEGRQLMQQTHAELSRRFKEVLPQLQRTYESGQKRLTELQASAEKLKAKPPAKKPAPAPRKRPAAPKVADIDPQLGQKLRVRLLEELRQSLVTPSGKPAPDLSLDAWQGWIENSSIGFTPDAAEQAVQDEVARKRAQGFGRQPAAPKPEAKKTKPQAKDANPDGGAWEDWIEGTSWS